MLGTKSLVYSLWLVASITISLRLVSGRWLASSSSSHCFGRWPLASITISLRLVGGRCLASSSHCVWLSLSGVIISLCLVGGWWSVTGQEASNLKVCAFIVEQACPLARRVSIDERGSDTMVCAAHRTIGASECLCFGRRGMLSSGYFTLFDDDVDDDDVPSDDSGDSGSEHDGGAAAGTVAVGGGSGAVGGTVCAAAGRRRRSAAGGFGVAADVVPVAFTGLSCPCGCCRDRPLCECT